MTSTDRAAFQEALPQALAYLKEVLGDTKQKTSDRIKAAEIIERRALGPPKAMMTPISTQIALMPAHEAITIIRGLAMAGKITAEEANTHVSLIERQDNQRLAEALERLEAIEELIMSSPKLLKQIRGRE